MPDVASIFDLIASLSPETLASGLFALLLVLLMMLMWAMLRLRQLREAALSLEDVEEVVAAGLSGQHRALLADLHGVIERQADRGAAHREQLAERLHTRLASELHGTRSEMQSSLLGVLGQLAKHKEETGVRLTEIAGGLNAGQEKLRGEITERMLEKLSEHGRADRELLAGSIEALTRSIDERMASISGKVSERLDEGFRKTNETFANVMARLATIDEAQKKIDGLATNVVNLQQLLGDKKSRGAFGEVQLEALVRNALPPDAYDFQSVLPNGARVDCLLSLPEPTGQVAVDSKFPLENYQRMTDPEQGELERKAAQLAFRADVKKHVDAISSKYIIDDVTSDGAVMFLPAEAVFAEIHAYQPEIVAYALERRVWIVSPTTLMAVLNTARAVLKDIETRKQIHVIKDALGKLAKDFTRFDERMQRLATHIDQASRDVKDVHTSSRKISAHFRKIESARVDELPAEEAEPRLVVARRAPEG